MEKKDIIRSAIKNVRPKLNTAGHAIRRKLAQILGAIAITIVPLSATACDIMFDSDDEKDYKNIGTAEYVIENRSGKSDQDEAVLDMLNAILEVYKHHAPQFFDDLVRDTRIKTIINIDKNVNRQGWMRVGKNEINLNINSYGNYPLYARPHYLAEVMRHELTHILQDRAGVFGELNGLRPDVGVAVRTFTEICAVFFGNAAYEIARNDTERQSATMRYMMEPWELRKETVDILGYEPEGGMIGMWAGIMGTQVASIVDETIKKEIKPAKVLGDDEIMALMRRIATAKDPDVRDVDDETISFVYNRLIAATQGNNRYVEIGDTGSELFPAHINQKTFDRFNELIIQWDLLAGQRNTTRSIGNGANNSEMIIYNFQKSNKKSL